MFSLGGNIGKYTIYIKYRKCRKIYNMFCSGGSWTPHKVELAVWTHYVARDNKPEILADMPSR